MDVFYICRYFAECRSELIKYLKFHITLYCFYITPHNSTGWGLNSKRVEKSGLTKDFSYVKLTMLHLKL